VHGNQALPRLHLVEALVPRMRAYDVVACSQEGEHGQQYAFLWNKHDDLLRRDLVIEATDLCSQQRQS
jgi:hypothetical protein